MSNIPNDPHLASFPRPQTDNGRGMHFVLNLKTDVVQKYTPYIKQMHLSWVTVYGGDENDTCQAGAYIYQQTGAFPLLRAQSTPPSPGRPNPPGHKYPDFYGKQLALAKQLGIPGPYIQIGNEPTTEGWTLGAFGSWWIAAALLVVQAGGYPGLQVTGESEFQAVVPGLQSHPEIVQKMWMAHHGQPANHPPGYPFPPYQPRAGQYLPGDTRRPTDDAEFLSALQYPEWSAKYLGGVTLPVMTTEGPWAMQSPGDTPEDARYPAVTPDVWLQYESTVYDMFKTGVLPNGDPLPDWWFSFNYWLLQDGGAWQANGLLGSWHPEWKVALVNKLTNDPVYVRQFGGTPPPPPPPPPTSVSPSASTSPSPSPSPSAAPSGILSDIELAHLVMDAGFSMQDVAIAIILAESGGNPLAKNTAGNTPPSTDRGLWQINSYWHPEVSDDCAYDPVCSTRAAFTIAKGGADYTPWASYNQKTYLKFIDRAEAALAATQVIVPTIDPRLKWVSFLQGKNYQVSEVWFYNNTPPDDPESENNINIYTCVYDTNGRALNHEAVTQKWPDGSSTHYTRNGMTAHQMSGDSNFDPNRGQSGPYAIQVGDASVSGLGLPLRQHVEFLIVFTKL